MTADRSSPAGKTAALAGMLVAAALCLSLASPADASPCRSETFEGAEYTVCSFDLTEVDLRTFWKDADGGVYGTFSSLARDLDRQKLKLDFAMNGGMYREDFTPVGQYIENGKELKQANLADSPADVRPVPNFYKKPNGVFYIGDRQAGVLETKRFLKARAKAKFATQSGPMLVIDGKIHPAFKVGSTDLNQRNGVCASSPTEVHFAISEDDVNFHDFARFFRDKLGCKNALFLDGGSAPGIYVPELGRNDAPGHYGYGPIIGVVSAVP